MTTPAYATIEQITVALGKLCLAWAHLEEACFLLSTYQFDTRDDEALSALRNLLDIRMMTQLQKQVALAKRRSPLTKHVVNFSDRIETDIRPFRNSYIHDPVYTFGNGAFERTEYRTRIRKPQAFKDAEIIFSHQHPIYEGEIEAFEKVIRAAEEYAGQLMFLLDCQADLDEDPSLPMEYDDADTASDALASAIAEYKRVSRSSV